MDRSPRIDGPEDRDRRPRDLRLAARAAAVAGGALLLTLASSLVERSRLEVQDWDCPPAPASCAQPAVVAGFPVPYVSDYHSLSPVGSADLVGAVLGLDRFHPGAFWANVSFYGLLLAGIHTAWRGCGGATVAAFRALRGTPRGERRYSDA